MNMKTMGQILSVTLLTTLAVPLYCTPQPTQTLTLSKQEINQKIENLKKTMTGLKKITTVATIISAGVGITGTAIGLTIIIGGVAIGLLFPPTAAFGMPGTVGFVAASSAGLVTATSLAIGGIATMIVSGSLGAVGTILFGDISAHMITTAFTDGQQLKGLETEHPGTLTAEQMTIVTQFNNLIRGPLGKGIATGIQLKKIKDTISAQVIKDNPALATTLGGAQKTDGFIKNYLDDSRKLTNYKITYQQYQDHKKALQKQRAPYKKLDPKHIKFDLEIGALDLKFAFLKSTITNLEKKIAKMEQQYPNLKSIMASHLQNYMAQVDAFMLELASPTK